MTMTETDQIRHRADCTDPTTRVRPGRMGDQLLTCLDCGRFAPIADDGQSIAAGTCEACSGRCQPHRRVCKKCFTNQKAKHEAAAADAPDHMVAAPVDATAGRYELLCIGCPTVIRRHSPRASVPLCSTCRTDRHHAAAREQRERQAKREHRRRVTR